MLVKIHLEWHDLSNLKESLGAARQVWSEYMKVDQLAVSLDT